ncbi:15748_t:CDS:1, partial [Acaulospora colombiana]
LPENIANQHLTNSVSSDSTLVAPILTPAQFSKTAEIFGDMAVVKQNE